jgi:hypothetical protein
MRTTCRAGLVLLVAAGLAACQGGGEDTVPRRVSLSATTTTVEGAAGRDARPLPAGGTLDPGTYRTTVFEPATTFRVGAGWEVPFAETSGSFTLGRDVDSTAPLEGSYLTFVRVEQVFATPLLTDDQLRGARGRYLRPVPGDLVAWLRAHPYLEVSTPKRVRIGGLTGMRFDVGVTGLPDRPDTCEDLNPRQCVFLFPFVGSSEVVAAVEGPPSRNYVLDPGGPPLVITIDAPPAERAAFLAQAGKVLATVRFG